MFIVMSVVAFLISFMPTNELHVWIYVHVFCIIINDTNWKADILSICTLLIYMYVTVAIIQMVLIGHALVQI